MEPELSRLLREGESDVSEGKGRRRNSGVWFAFWGFRGEPRLVGGVKGVCVL